MTSRKLFPEPISPRPSYLAWTEPAVHWYTECTLPAAVYSRATVNGWYEQFPDKDDGLAKRIRSERDTDHKQALDELYVHHLLSRSYSDVRYEVGAVGPDFRVFVNEQCVGGVEVLSLFQQDEWTVEEQRHNRLADEVSKRLLPTHGYFVDFEIVAAEVEPAPRHFTDFLARHISSLPPYDTVTQVLEGPRYERNGVIIDVRFIPMKKDAPAKSDPDARIVGTGAVLGGMVNFSERLKSRLADKAGGRYGIVNAPFVIAVAAHDNFADDYNVTNALYGGEAVSYQLADPASVNAVRRNDGFFGPDSRAQGGQRNKRVSAVTVISDLPVIPEIRTEIVTYINPFATWPAPPDMPPAERRFGVTEMTPCELRLGWL